MNVAQYNLSILNAPPEEMGDFLSEIDRVNTLGNSAKGFVWRFATDGVNNSLADVVGDYIINLTVWRSIDDLWNFTFSGGHLDMLRRRRDWFVPGEMTNILWWIPEGELPTPDEAEARMAHYWEYGPSPTAFTWKTVPLSNERCPCATSA